MDTQLTLSPLPPSWVDAPDDGSRAKHFRVPLAEGPAVEKPSWLASMGQERPLVYATLGTVFNKMKRLRTAILDALADLDADVLMTVGRDVDPADIGTVPANVVVAIAGDQMLNARRAAELGFGVALDRSEAREEALHEGARHALEDPSFSAAAAALREECDAMEPIGAAVATLEEIAAAGPGA